MEKRKEDAEVAEQPKKKTKLSKRERKRGDPMLHANIDFLLEAAKNKVQEARTPVKPGLKFNWPLIRLAQSYIKELRALASKSTYRLPREVKHQFCKGCNVYRLPMVTSENKVMVRDGVKLLNMKCLICKKAKKLVIKKGITQKRANQRKAACVDSRTNQEMVVDKDQPMGFIGEETLPQ